MPRVNIIDAESFGLSPAEKTFNILKSGTPDFAELNIQFVESFGYALKEAFLNGVRLTAQSGLSLKANVIPFLKNGENKLVVIFDALQIFGYPLGQAQISASITYTGASILEVPSPSQALDDIGSKIKQSATIIIGLIIAVAVGLSALAFTSSRLPSFGGIKVTNQNLKSIASKGSETAKSLAKQTSSSLKSIQSKVEQLQ